MSALFGNLTKISFNEDSPFNIKIIKMVLYIAQSFNEIALQHKLYSRASEGMHLWITHRQKKRIVIGSYYPISSCYYEKEFDRGRSRRVGFLGKRSRRWRLK